MGVTRRSEEGRSGRRQLSGGARVLGVVAALTLLAGCDAFSDTISGLSASSGVQGAALKGPTVQPQNLDADERAERGLPNAGPALGTIRKTKIYNETHNVALRGGAPMTRKYIIQRADLQPMWSTQKSLGKAITAVSQTFAMDACVGGQIPMVTAAYRDPIGVWTVEVSCAADAVAMIPMNTPPSPPIRRPAVGVFR